VYRLKFLDRAIKDLDGIDRSFQKIIKAKLEILAEDPRALKSNIIAIKGETDLFRLRIGSYRVIFRKNELELIILIVRIGHRKNVYRT